MGEQPQEVDGATSESVPTVQGTVNVGDTLQATFDAEVVRR
jgi:hypothetical protein